jgi:uncharacterized membrane protein
MAPTLTGKERYHTNTQDMEWNEERAASSPARHNVGDKERMLSAFLGGTLLISGLPRRSWTGAGLSLLGAALLHRGLSGYCALFDAMGFDTSEDGHATNRLGRRKVETSQATKIRRTIEINRPPADLYRFWRSLENLPRIMSHLESVQAVNDRMSHWKVRTVPGGPSVEWDAEIINDIENERIGWRSLHGADVDNTGSVEFEPAGDGRRTKLTVTLQYATPAGRLGAALAKLFGEDPDSKIAQDLQRFKESMEAGVYR